MEASSSAVNYNEGEEYSDDLALASSVVNQMPPGFRFHPTDPEIIFHYVLNKVKDRSFRAVAVGDIDLNKCDPWDLPQKAKIGESEWFFFCEKKTRYQSGQRTNRATPSGYWKGTGKDKEIYRDKKRLVGMKKTLVFYKGRPPKGEKSNWVIHEYRLQGDYSSYNLSTHAMEKWVVCKVLHKNNEARTNPAGLQLPEMNSFVDNFLLDSPTPLLPQSNYSANIEKPSSSYADDQITKPTTSLPTLMLPNNYTLQDSHSNLLFPPPMMNRYNQYSLIPYQSPSIVYQLQDRPTMQRVATKLEEDDPIDPNSRMCKMEETGINSSESKMACDEVVVEGCGFSPNISDLDSLWN